MFRLLLIIIVTATKIATSNLIYIHIYKYVSAAIARSVAHTCQDTRGACILGAH